MNIRLLKIQDIKKLEEYLAPHKTESMFICSNLKAAGIEYRGADFEGEYFGYFDNHNDHAAQLIGVIVHYWNGNVLMHASNHIIIEQLTLHLKNNIKRPVAGILGLSTQAEHVIKNLGLTGARFSLNSNEGLYEINLADLNEFSLPNNFNVVSVQDVPRDVLVKWTKSYDIEALGALNDEALEKQVAEDVNRRLQKNDSWVLLSDKIPVSLSAFNARLTDVVQVGPVYTPPEYRNKGFARLLLAYTLHQEKCKGIKQAILFTNNPAAVKAYLAIGFKKIGNYRLALLEKPINLYEIEFTTSPVTTDIDFLTQKINEEKPTFGEAHPFAFFIRGEAERIIAGCNGSVIFGCIYTDQLWVDKTHRMSGYGKKLMAAVHDYGRQVGCSMAAVNTMDFQHSKVFYEKLEYVVDFERQGYTQNSRCLFMKKEL